MQNHKSNKEQDAESMLARAITLFNEKRMRESLDVLAELRENYTGKGINFYIYHYCGRCYMELADYDNAIKYLLLAQNQMDANLQTIDQLNNLDLIGSSYLAIYKYSEAFEYYKKAEKLYHLYEGNTWRMRRIYFQFAYADCLRFIKDYDAAFKRLQLVRSELNDEDYFEHNKLNYDLCALYMQEGDYSAAKKHLDLIDLDNWPEEYRAGYHLLKGRILINTDNNAEAIHVLSEAMNYQQPNWSRAEAYNLIGKSHFNLNNMAEAKDNFTKSLNFDDAQDWLRKSSHEYLKKIDDRLNHN